MVDVGVRVQHLTPIVRLTRRSDAMRDFPTAGLDSGWHSGQEDVADNKMVGHGRLHQEAVDVQIGNRRS